MEHAAPAIGDTRVPLTEKTEGTVTEKTEGTGTKSTEATDFTQSNGEAEQEALKILRGFGHLAS